MPEVGRTVDIAAEALRIASDIRCRGLVGEERDDEIAIRAAHVNAESVLTTDKVGRFTRYILNHIDDLEVLTPLIVEE